jgi:hypothetical protein
MLKSQLNAFLPVTIFACLVTGCATEQPKKTNPLDGPMNVATTIIDSHAFDEAPVPRTKALHYQATSVATNQVVASLDINLQRTMNRITQYQATRKEGPSTFQSDSISVSGLAPFTEMQQKITLMEKGSQISASQYKVLDINQVEGNLFPLKVGNTLSYHFNAIKASEQVKKHAIEGSALFEVTNKLVGFTYGGNIIPGNIYTIRYSEARGGMPLEVRAQYMLSEKLGWFVQATEYKSGIPTRIYNLVDAQNSLAFMKPPSAN